MAAVALSPLDRSHRLAEQHNRAHLNLLSRDSGHCSSQGRGAGLLQSSGQSWLGPPGGDLETFLPFGPEVLLGNYPDPPTCTQGACTRMPTAVWLEIVKNCKHILMELAESSRDDLTLDDCAALERLSSQGAAS